MQVDVRRLHLAGDPGAVLAAAGRRSPLWAGWKRQQGKGDVGQRVEQDQDAKVRHLKAELRRVTEARDILEKAAGCFAGCQVSAHFWQCT